MLAPYQVPAGVCSVSAGRCPPDCLCRASPLTMDCQYAAGKTSLVRW